MKAVRRCRPTGVHHVDLVVSSIERSLPFYRDLLAPLGYHGISEVEGERGETIYYLWGPAASIGLREAQSPSGDAVRPLRASACTTSPSRRRRAPRSTSAPSGSASTGAEIESGPQEYAYSLGYYAVFFYDPDGLKLEIVHVPRHAA